jgi:hypothetical protein
MKTLTLESLILSCRLPSFRRTKSRITRQNDSVNLNLNSFNILTVNM